MKRILVVLVLLLGLAGCSSSSGTAATPPVCDSWEAVQVTVGHIKNVNVSENGLSALQPYLTQLKDQLSQLYLDAKAQFAAQAEALKAAAQQLGDDLRTARANPDRTTLAAVRSSVAEVRTSADSLHTAMGSTC
ncbi:ABC-type Zn uptake system ZnuABC Zn-binding protein ZnuA [Actinoplanes octamycinicus]|uniref:ABC-type Zn uptake system ZnuABC Zn-binding protein ZnuA n=1 Tax=Actinoplanes octamycinicus TaxID=135948 RepID=A0A7W7M7V0_9ACTN|nr:lipoprotein [Actinoplanes octamycinicus]MBB4740131.1 ABC-type Zn uptake system ZnuABC Zn-binding protein ZnuA [Actinoplanes octamycinicus]GIE59528.1 hypothetical protein Aoc01nite_49300 [Actinoplanes octamycinicus]